MKATPHLVVAGLISLIAIAVTVGPLTTGGGDYPIVNTDPKVSGPVPEVVPASVALTHLVEGADRMPVDSPFTLRKSGVIRGPRIGLPPPPPLDLPEPPMLPLVEVSP
jgi:hypothetical protein